MEKENQSLGQYLQESRKKSNKSLSEVAELSKINKTILEKLEQDDHKNLPNRTFLRGFIKTYLKICHGDISHAMSLLDIKEKNPSKGSFESAVCFPSEDSTSKAVVIKKKSPRKKGLYLFMGLVLVMIALYLSPVKVWIQEQFKIVKIELEEPLESLQELEEAFQEENNQPPVIKKPAPTASPVSLSVSYPFSPIQNPLFTTSDLASSTLNSKHLQNIDKALNTNKHSVYLIASNGNSWMAYREDESSIKQVILKKGRNHLLSAQKEILLFLGNYKAVEIFYNGKVVSPVATKSGVKTLIFPSENRNFHYLPLFMKGSNGEFYTSVDYQKKLLKGEKPSRYYLNFLKARNKSIKQSNLDDDKNKPQIP